MFMYWVYLFLFILGVEFSRLFTCPVFRTCSFTGFLYYFHRTVEFMFIMQYLVRIDEHMFESKVRAKTKT
jgi:hypothetical protein